MLLLALGNEAAQVPVELDLLLVDLLQGAVLSFADALLGGGGQLMVVGGGGIHWAKTSNWDAAFLGGGGRGRPPDRARP